MSRGRRARWFGKANPLHPVLVLDSTPAQVMKPIRFTCTRVGHLRRPLITAATSARASRITACQACLPSGHWRALPRYGSAKLPIALIRLDLAPGAEPATSCTCRGVPAVAAGCVIWMGRRASVPQAPAAGYSMRAKVIGLSTCVRGASMENSS